MSVIVQRAARALVRPVERLLPPRYALPFEILRERLAGRLEREIFLLDALAGRRRELALDVGANRGYYAYHLAKLFRRVEAFEPNPAVLGPLRAWGAGNVAIRNVAVSCTEGETELFVPIVNGVRQPGWASFDRDNLPGAHDFEVIRVPVRPLDAFGFRGVSFVKMDVEGHEPAALRGAERTLRENQPVVLLEVKEKNRDGVFAFFDALGYAPFRVREGRLAPVGASGEADGENFVFRPAEGARRGLSAQAASAPLAGYA
ncbi:MAG TPA: FkbM family methyltransferase [Longimicrobiaceae bacterium]|nr:FkbM family methyltransferase [Longimicrobiaceae bacterium]